MTYKKYAGSLDYSNTLHCSVLRVQSALHSKSVLKSANTIYAYLAAAIYIVGVFIDEGPPVPIPNTEVKLICADNTRLETVWEDRSMPTLNGA